MPTPTQRHTTSRRNNRRSHFALHTAKSSTCKHCGKPVLPHTLCQNCGYYDGRQVVDVLAKLTKKEKKQKAQELKEQEKGAHKHPHQSEGK